MGNLFKAFFFKIRKDISFRITCFIGLGFSILIPLIFFLIDLGISFIDGNGGPIEHNFATGQSLLVSSWSPTQNFGLAIPINLITFTVAEFSAGTIRNKIISGYSKTKIYLGLYFTGLVYTLALISTYVLICFGLGCAFGGFNPNGNIFSATSMSGGQITPEFIWKIIVLSLLAYTVIASMTIFFASLFRIIGPTIPVVIILIIACSFMGTIAQVLMLFNDGEDATTVSQIMTGVGKFLKAVNPLHSLLIYDTKVTIVNPEPEVYDYVTTVGISWSSFWTEVANNLVYIAAFFTGGLLLFRKRDVK